MARPWETNAAPHRTLHTGDRGEDVQRFQKALEARSGIPVPNHGIIDKATLAVKRRVFFELGLPSREHPITATAQKYVRWPGTRSDAAKRRAKARKQMAGLHLDPTKGAKSMVETAVRICQRVHSDLYVVSDYRPGDPMDHGSNDWDKAARDIAVPGIDALRGPWPSELNDAVLVLGDALGRKYAKSGGRIVDTWHWEGWRMQVIARTSEYGGHLGHIHVGVHRD